LTRAKRGRRLRHHRAMALNATIHPFDIELADSDRGIYQSLALRVARHPSEATDFLVARVLAYCLEWDEGIGFSKGLSTPDEPAIHLRDLTGRLLAWIDVGVPDAARVHRAAKAAPRVAVYTHKDPALLQLALRGARIHRAEHLVLRALDRPLIETLVARLARRTAWSVAVSGGHLYVTVDDRTHEGQVLPVALDTGTA
jgi:uncharacterized protein YaeQ